MPTDPGLRLAIYNSNLKAARSNPRLSPETGKPISTLTKSRYAVGFLVFGLLWMSGLGIVSAVLLSEHLKSVPGMAPEALVGIINSCTAVASLMSNLMFGLNCMLAPMVAIISDRIPAAVRGTMSAFYGAGSTCGAPIAIAFALLGCVFIMLIRGVR